MDFYFFKKIDCMRWLADRPSLLNFFFFFV